MLYEVREFSELARAGAYIAGDGGCRRRSGPADGGQELPLADELATARAWSHRPPGGPMQPVKVVNAVIASSAVVK